MSSRQPPEPALESCWARGLFATAIGQWEAFRVLVGEVSATLTGLLVVSVALTLDRIVANALLCTAAGRFQLPLRLAGNRTCVRRE